MNEGSQFVVSRLTHHRLATLVFFPVCRFRPSAAAAVLAGVIGALAIHGQAVAQLSDWTLSKTPSPATYSAAGQVIKYTYVVTSNTNSSGSLFGISDDKVATVDCPTLQMPASGSITCTGEYTTTAADVANGRVNNTATATGDSCDDGCDVTATAQATITLIGHPMPALSPYGLVFVTFALMMGGVLSLRRQSR